MSWVSDDVDAAKAILDKAIKSKPSEVKVRVDLHKKANGQLKTLKEKISSGADGVIKQNEVALTTWESALGVADSEATLREHALVHHIRQVVKNLKKVPQPKGLADNFDKAAKSVAAWDPKGESVDVLKEATKSLDAGNKAVQEFSTAYDKAKAESDAMRAKVKTEMTSSHDEDLKKALARVISF
jgi:hypothetical protein